MGSESIEAMNTAGQIGRGSTDIGGKFLTFFLAGEEYGLEILKVHEIIGMMPITPVPRTPKFIKGVINLRGKVIPVVDLRLKLAMDAKDQTEETCVIVVQTSGVQIGVIVDKVSEVLDIANGDIEDSPAFGANVNSDYILGIGKSEGSVKLLLDIDKVLSAGDVADMGSLTADSTVDEAGIRLSTESSSPRTGQRTRKAA